MICNATGSNILIKCFLESFDSKNTCLHQTTAYQVDCVLSFHFWKLVPVQQPEAHGNIKTTMLTSKVGKTYQSYKSECPIKLF